MSLKRPREPMPGFVKTELEKRGLIAVYNDRPAYQRNDYLWWINDAKRGETKRRRLAKMIQELEAGQGYMGMEWSPSQSL